MHGHNLQYPSYGLAFDNNEKVYEQILIGLFECPEVAILLSDPWYYDENISFGIIE